MSGLLPQTQRGRRSAKAEHLYQQQLAGFCNKIIEIKSSLDFDISARGWCYMLEDYGLFKGDFDKAQALIADCRKSGMLPLEIVAEDSAREYQCLEALDSQPEDEAEAWLWSVQNAYLKYAPVSFWDELDCYIEMWVEKIDLKSLFLPVCAEYKIPIANCRGWSDLNMRAAMMRRFAKHEAEGRQCVLLYCGDHDPAGLQISGFIRGNLAELSRAVGWQPDNLIVDRFGLNADFILKNNLTWIDNLETGSGRRLDSPRHPDHAKPYVQDYLSRFGARKVEANALVVRPAAGRELCREAILRYVPEQAPVLYEQKLAPWREQLRNEIKRQFAQGGVL